MFAWSSPRTEMALKSTFKYHCGLKWDCFHLSICSDYASLMAVTPLSLQSPNIHIDHTRVCTCPSVFLCCCLTVPIPFWSRDNRSVILIFLRCQKSPNLMPNFFFPQTTNNAPMLLTTIKCI
uniref:Uncharacterized protein n=1 Tax=Mus musculus TaxID=10090 RepID=Q8CBX7_MOUSE|nr:unnamed protein product [Mus musculus]